MWQATSSNDSAAVVLTFHGIGPFCRNLNRNERGRWLKTTSFLEILDVVQQLPEAILTFDDGNASDMEIALPAIKSRKMTATFFVISEYLNQPGYLSTRALRDLSTEGMRIGSHGMSHRNWTQLTSMQLNKELAGSRENLEDLLGDTITEASCPFGAYNRRVLRAARLQGYNVLYTSDRGRASLTHWVRPRNSVLHNHTAHDVQEFFRRRALLKRLKDSARFQMKSIR